MDLKQRIAQVIPYAEAFWQHDLLDRPYTTIKVPPQDASFRYSQSACFEAGVSGDYDKFLIPYMEYLRRTEYAGDALPSMNLNLGADQYAAFLGAEIHNSWEQDTAWVVPFLEDPEAYTPRIDRSENGHFHKMKRFYEYAKQAAGGEFILEMADLHSNLDAISAIRGPENLCMDLYDCPEDIHRILNAVRKTYPEVYEMLYAAGDMKQTGTIGWIPLYCSGKCAVVQCDFSYMISPEHGREFVFPAVQEEAEYLDHCVYHMDGIGELRHLDTILSIDAIDCIQWVPGAGQPPTYAWLDLLKQIQAAGKAVWIEDWTPEQIRAYHKELKPNLVSYSLTTKTKAEADSLIEFLRKHS